MRVKARSHRAVLALFLMVPLVLYQPKPARAWVQLAGLLGSIAAQRGLQAGAVMAASRAAQLQHLQKCFSQPAVMGVAGASAAMGKGVNVAFRSSSGWVKAGLNGAGLFGLMAALKKDYWENDAGPNITNSDSPASSAGFELHPNFVDGTGQTYTYTVRIQWPPDDNGHDAWVEVNGAKDLGSYDPARASQRTVVFTPPANGITLNIAVFDAGGLSCYTTSKTVPGNSNNPWPPDAPEWAGAPEPATNPNANEVADAYLGDSQLDGEPITEPETPTWYEGAPGPNGEPGPMTLSPTGTAPAGPGGQPDPGTMPEPEPDPSAEPSSAPSTDPSSAPSPTPSGEPPIQRPGLPNFDRPFFVTVFIQGMATKFPWDLLQDRVSYADPPLRMVMWGYDTDLSWMTGLLQAIKWVSIIGLIWVAILML